MQNQLDETNTGSSHSFQDSTVSFEELGIEPTVIRAISELGFVHPTPIQQETIPSLFENKNDLIGLAQTGTGKTAAFGLPLVQWAEEKSKATTALILSPTRELCVQIAKDLKNFSRYKKGINVVPIYGGASIDAQARELRRGAQIIAATPGRMLDMINRGLADVSKIETLVLDEADEMLNMGFKDELDSILENTPGEKRTLLFSATMMREVERIARQFMHDPIEITVGKKNQGAENVKHAYYVVHARDRYMALKRIVDFYPDIYSIIFCRTRVETQEVADKLMSDGYSADTLHGDLSQAQRDTVMQKFRMKNLQLLVATDVAARGLDVDSLTHIINYNLPDDPEQYTHRSGRTGRAGKTGISIAILNLKEKYKIKHIEKVIGKKFHREQVPTGKEVCEKQLYSQIDRMEKINVYNEEIEGFLPTIYKKLEGLDREDLIKRFVSVEFNHFLDYYKKTPDINVDMRREPQGMSRFFINMGRKDNVTPQMLIGMINDISYRLSIKIGKIDIMHSFSFFEADSYYKDDILKSFNKRKVKGRSIVVEEAEASGAPSKRKGDKKSSWKSGEYRDSKDSRDSRDFKDSRDSRDSRDSKGPKKKKGKKFASPPKGDKANPKKKGKKKNK